MKFLKTYRKDVLFTGMAALVFGMLLYLETHLPFFRKFLPVGENKLIIILLNVNLLLILLLIFLIVRIVLKAYIEKKRGIFGSGLKTKLILTMVSISIVSSFTLFVMTTWFFYVSMDKWFGQKIEDTIDNALELSQFYYDDIFRRYETIGSHLAAELERKNLLEKERELTKFVSSGARTYFLDYLALYDMEGRPIRTYNALKEEMDQQISRKAKDLAAGKKTRQILPLKDGELIVCGIAVTDAVGNPRALLFIGEKLRVQGTEGVKRITATYEEYKESRPLKKLVKYSFIIPLFLITILTIFFSIWVGNKMATEITVPLERVKEGAAIIASGRFDINLEDRGKDEIGTLVSAFNRMAKELKVTKDEIEEKRRYMEVILDNVATGIITTDPKGNVLLMNSAARTILSVGSDDWVGRPLRDVLGDEFKSLVRSFLREMKRGSSGSIVKEMRLSLKNDTVYLRAALTTLTDETGGAEGYVATFDDITHILKAEKLATWREVAKKLTHEIKNPLTPIRLSAERLRRRVLPGSEGKQKEILDETTSVILSASEDIAAIVNELTRLTHAASAQTLEDLNAIVEETIGLYKNLYTNIVFRFDRAALPQFRMEKDKLKRALINLITNSVKAIDSADGVVTVSTRFDRGRGLAMMEVSDTGPGIADDDKGRVFDPYFTRNKDGMGLGLAIVHSIVLEHHGNIRVEDNTPKGTRFVVELPVTEAKL